MATEALLEQVLKLPVHERAEFARQVLLSLKPDEVTGDAEQAWLAEIQRRRLAIRQGDVQLLEWVDVRRQILGELSRARSA
jgi:putative addiction module component (TIGR02574 family)